MLTFDVRIYKLRIRSGRRRPFTVRWRVGSRDHSESYQFEAQADGRRAELMAALRLGEQFDTFTGLPASELRARNTVTWFEHAVEYAAVKWPRVSAKHRAGIADALATVTMALVRPSSGQAPPALRRALLSWAFRMVRGRDRTWTPRMKVEQAPAEVARGLEWIARHSLSLAEAARPHRLRAVLAAVSRRMDGSEAAENTVQRKRIVLSNALVYAVSCERLQANPLPKVDWQPPLTDIEVDFRYVPGPRLARDLITAVGTQGPRGAHLEAFFGCLYYAAMRPAEAAALTEKDCLLPGPQAGPDAWGELVLARSHPEAGSSWTDDGRPHDTRGLKRRARNATRNVPIPPVLVHLLRAHLERYGTAPDGRLFRAVRGGPRTLHRILPHLGHLPPPHPPPSRRRNPLRESPLLPAPRRHLPVDHRRHPTLRSRPTRRTQPHRPLPHLRQTPARPPAPRQPTHHRRTPGPRDVNTHRT